MVMLALALPTCQTMSRTRAADLFEVPPEIGGHVGAPRVERVGRRVVLGLPGHVGRDVVDVAKILGEAAPGIADVMEEIRTDDVAAEAPAVAVALVEQPAAADADLVYVGHLEAGVVVARALVLEEGEHVVVAATLAVAQESDDVRRAVRQPHADDAGVEIDLLLQVWRE